jgi:hypothetical protein
MSTVSLNSNDEDWDRSEADMQTDEPSSSSQHRTPRNSVAFPATHGDDDDDVIEGALGGRGRNKRSLSELLRIHAEKGTDCVFSAEEAARLAEVLGAWVSGGFSLLCLLYIVSLVLPSILLAPHHFYSFVPTESSLERLHTDTI